MTRHGPAIRILDRVLVVDGGFLRRTIDTPTRTARNTAIEAKKLGKTIWKAWFFALNASPSLL
jgi:hypothetical protein